MWPCLLYVDLSRVGSFSGVRVLTSPPEGDAVKEYLERCPGMYTRNVVYSEVLRDA